MSGTPDLSPELADLHIIGANLHEVLGRMARKLAGTADGNAHRRTDGHYSACAKIHASV
jgi:hypothetical protein